MKAIKCEMCDSSDVVKQGDFFVCQHCGTKYEPEAARKLLVEVDNSKQLNNIRELAKRAREDGDYETAAKYYAQLLEHNPDDWEAYLYAAIAKAKETTIANIAPSATQLEAAIKTSCRIYRSKESFSADDAAAFNAALMDAIAFEKNAKDVALKTYRNYVDKHYAIYAGSMNTPPLPMEYKIDVRSRLDACRHLITTIATELETMVQREDEHQSAYKVLAALAFGETFETSRAYYVHNNGSSLFALLPYDELSSFAEKANSYVPNTVTAEDLEIIKTANESTARAQSSGGCYVATAVYGSYDCPQVWTLRRFRDFELAETFYGRAFIRVYYAISPTLVKWFGNTEWFKKLWRGRLDNLVEKCRKKGFADTPYNDRVW